MRRAAINVGDLRAQARRRLPRMVFDFIDGGAEDEYTLRANRQAFQQVELSPNVLVDVEDRELGATILGETLSLPVLLAPTGLARLAGPGGDIAAGRAARKCGTVALLSCASSDSIEAVAEHAGPQWFQLYPWVNREVTRQLLDRAAASGYHALCVTVDVPTMGGRERDIRRGFTIPPKVNLRTAIDVGRHPQWWWRVLTGPSITFSNFIGVEGAPSTKSTVGLARWAATLNDPSQTWDDLGWIRERWDGPLLLKGILHPDDAVRAASLGCDGIVVSNHGGRQLDGVPASLRVLPAIRDAVEGELAVLMDGGIRRGTDVLKALASGADAVLVGRPWLWGLAADGERGVAKMLSILRAELDRAMILVGCRRVDELGPSHIRVLQDLEASLADPSEPPPP